MTVPPIGSAAGQWLLIGVALGAIPTSQLSQLLLAVLGKKLGVKPGEIRKYDDATNDGDSGGGG